MTTKKAAKKRVAKKASSKITLKDDTLYVVSSRNKLLSWTPVAVYETRAEANRVREALEERSYLAFMAAKVDVVKLQRG